VWIITGPVLPAFFTPLDRFNERWHELNAHPDCCFSASSSRRARNSFPNSIARRQHPKTTFIGAHFGNNAEDLASVGKALDEHPT